MAEAPKQNISRTGRLAAFFRGITSVLSIALIFCGLSAVRAQLPAASQQEVTSEDDFGAEHLEVPFILRNNCVVIDVKLGKDADSLKTAPVLHLLLDTGATNITVSKEAFESNRLELKTLNGGRSREHLTGVGSSSVAVSRVVDAIIQFGEVLTPCEVEVVPLGNDLKNAQIDGFIGSNLIRNCVIVVDYAKHIVQIYSPNAFKPPSKESKFIAIPVTFNSFGAPVADVNLTPFGYSSSHARLVLDTGDAGAVTLYSPFVSRNKWRSLLGVTTASQSAGVGGHIEVSSGSLRALEFGGTNLDRPPTDFSVSTTGLTASAEADGQLGGRVFRRFTMIFDYSHKTVYVCPNPSAKGPFPAQYYFGFMRSAHTTSSSNYSIGFVEPDSPAFTADMRVGDILETVDGQAVDALTDEAVYARLQESGKPRKFEIRRGVQRLTLTITPIAY